MVSQTLQRLEAAVSKIVTQGAPPVVAELQDIANSDPQNPAPLLVLAIVTAFAHQNLDQGRQYVSQAGKLLQGGGAGGDVEAQFSQSLYDVLQNEFTLAGAQTQVPVIGPVSIEIRRQAAQAAAASRKGQDTMGGLVAQLKSALVNTIYAAVQVHSLANGVNSAEYKQGMTALNRLGGSRAATADLAGFFAMYGYRKAHDYRNAIRVGEKLEARNPNSAMPKIMLGSANLYAGNANNAVKYFQQAVQIAPNDPSAALGLAHALKRANQVGQAQQILDKAQTLDQQGVFQPFIQDLADRITVSGESNPG